jgi:hypothetical protein
LSSDIIPKQKLWLRNWRRKLTNWQTTGCGSFPSLSPTAERASSLQRIQVAAMDKIRMLKILIFMDMIIGALGLAGYFIGGNFRDFLEGATPGILLGFALLFSIMLYSESKK